MERTIIEPAEEIYYTTDYVQSNVVFPNTVNVPVVQVAEQQPLPAYYNAGLPYYPVIPR